MQKRFHVLPQLIDPKGVGKGLENEFLEFLFADVFGQIAPGHKRSAHGHGQMLVRETHHRRQAGVLHEPDHEVREGAAVDVGPKQIAVNERPAVGVAHVLAQRQHLAARVGQAQVHGGDHVTPVAMACGARIGLIEQGGFPNPADLVLAIDLKGVVVEHDLGKAGRQGAAIVVGIGVGGLTRAGEAEKGDGAFALGLGSIFGTTGKIDFLDAAVAGGHAQAHARGPGQGQGAFFAFAEITHAQVKDDIGIFIDQGELGATGVVVIGVGGGPVVKPHHEDVGNRESGAFFVRLGQFFIGGEIRQPVKDVDRIVFGGNDGGLDHEIGVQAQNSLGLDQRIALHAVYGFAQIRFDFAPFHRFHAGVKAPGHGRAADDAAVAVIEYGGTLGKPQPSGCRRIDGQIGIHDIVLVFGQRVGLGRRHFANALVQAKGLGNGPKRRHFGHVVAVVVVAGEAGHETSIGR